MSEMLVSIIIPVYKTEKYLAQCVQSALTQHYPATEIILVDDGSPDRCPEIVDFYAQKYERVIAIHQENQGQGIARNTGVMEAQGEYVFMMDSDDCLDGPDAIGNLAEEAMRSGADVIVGNYRKFMDGIIWDVNRHHLEKEDDPDTEDFRFDGFYRFGHLAYNWGKLYRREFLLENDVWSMDYPYTQDKAFNILCYACRPKYSFIDESVYLYRVHDESVTFQYKQDFSEIWVGIAEDFHLELEDRGLEDHYQDITAFHVFFGSFFLVKQELMAKNGIWKAKAALRDYGRNLFVRKRFRELAGGAYIKQLHCLPWRFVIRVASMLFSMRGYFLFTLGIVLLRALNIDGRITEKRNRAEKQSKWKNRKKAAAAGNIVSKEAECLCLLLRRALTGVEAMRREKELLERVKIEEVLSMAREHKVLPMLWDVLEELFEEKNPKLLESARPSTESVVKQSYRLLFLTKELTEAIRAKDVPVVVLKGCGVASYYPVPEYRKSGDVDLLFKSVEDAQTAGKILEGMHYELKEEQHANHHLVYQGKDEIDVELHAMLAEPFDDERINERMEELLPSYLEEAGKTKVMGLSIPTTSEPLQALELLLHMLQHFLRAGFGLKLLADWVVFWNQVDDEETAARFRKLAEECGVTGFAKAVTLICEKYLGLTPNHVYGNGLEAEFSKGYVEQFLMEVISAEEFGKADKNRMVALRKRSILGYAKEFHYQMKMNHAKESKHVWKWPWLWYKTFVTFLRNNKKLGRGSLRSILKSAGERAGVVEEMRLFK